VYGIVGNEYVVGVVDGTGAVGIVVGFGGVVGTVVEGGFVVGGDVEGTVVDLPGEVVVVVVDVFAVVDVLLVVPYPHVQFAEHDGGLPETMYDGPGDDETDPQPAEETVTAIVQGGAAAPALDGARTTATSAAHPSANRKPVARRAQARKFLHAINAPVDPDIATHRSPRAGHFASWPVISPVRQGNRRTKATHRIGVDRAEMNIFPRAKDHEE
jgi:hypothetical protein